MFVITGSEYLIVRISHASIVLILLLCHVCDQSKWVLDCQNPTCMHGTHLASVSYLWSKQVSAWLSEFCMCLWCSFCFCAMFVVTVCECLIVRILHASMVLILLCVMFVIKGCKCLIVRILHASMVLILLLCCVFNQSKWVLDCQNSTCIHGAYSASVPCLSSKPVSAWLSESHIHAWCSFCFCAMFVIKACECFIVIILHASMVLILCCVMFVIKECKCFIVRILHPSMVLILLLCHVCNQSKWVLNCQNSTCIHGAYCASVPCWSSKPVSAWLSESHMHAWYSFCFCAMFVIKACECMIVRILHVSMVFILLLRHVCDQSMWVLDGQNSTCIYYAHSACMPCLWLQQVSAWLSDFQMHAWCSFCLCAMFVITACECLIIRIPHASMVLIMLLCHVCDHSLWVLDGQNSTCIYDAHSASVWCLWLQQVSAWLSDF